MAVSSFFKNLFGSAKETANELIDHAETVIEETKVNAKPYLEKAEAFVEETVDKIRETATPHAEKAESFVEDAVSKVKEAATPYIEKAESLFDEAKTKSSEIIDNLTENKKTDKGDSGTTKI